MVIPEDKKHLIAQRFWSKVKRGKADECWLWLGAKLNVDYGAMVINGKKIGAHRVSYFLATGQQPGEMTMHTCDNPLCVNPAHLQKGTHLENMHDCTQKQRRLKHERNGRAKLNWQKVAAIRSLYLFGFRQQDLAKRFEVSQRLISLVVRNELWVGGCANSSL